MVLSTLLKAGLIGGLGFIGLSYTIESQMKKYDIDIIEPIDTVSIIMASYNEENLIGTAASSVRRQSIIEKYPQYFELMLVDSNSTDNTVEIAKPYFDKIITSPRGKLTARNIATNEARGNIIVSVDADTYYPYHWLNTLLEPFNNLQNPSIAAVSGSTFDYTGIPNSIWIVVDTLYNYMLNRNRMVGRNSAYYKHLHYLANGFDENINQFDINQIFTEEEGLFGNRLSKYGRVAYKLNASCYHLGGIKVLCRLGIADRDVCSIYGFGKDRF